MADYGKLSTQVLDSFCGGALMICLIFLLKVIWQECPTIFSLNVFFTHVILCCALKSKKIKKMVEKHS
jgi:hypothetical protein